MKIYQAIKVIDEHDDRYIIPIEDIYMAHKLYEDRIKIVSYNGDGMMTTKYFSESAGPNPGLLNLLEQECKNYIERIK